MVDAVVVAHGSGARARRCINALRHSSQPPGRIVLVDTSADGAALAALSDAGPWLYPIDRPDNPGYGAAANVGIAATDAAYVLVMNDDVFVDRDAIEHLVKHADSAPDVACVGPDFRNLDGSRQEGAFRFPGVAQAAIDAWPAPAWLRRGRLNGRVATDGVPADIDHPLGACMLLRRLAVDLIGGFSPDYWMYCEEIDLCRRLKDYGWRVAHVPAARVWHVGGASTGEQPDRMLAQLYRSRVRWYRTHTPPPVAKAALAAMRSGLRVRSAMDEAAGRSVTGVRGALEALDET